MAKSEGAKLDLVEAGLHKALDANKDNWKAVEALSNTLIRLYQRRARLFGLDAPQKVDIRGIYPSARDEISAERMERRRILAALPLDEQERIYEVFEAARIKADAGYIETTTPLVTNGADHRNGATVADTNDADNSETGKV